MYYLILGHDGPTGLALRKANRPQHMDYVRRLQAEGRLLTAGPRPRIDAGLEGGMEAGFYGGLIIAEFANLAAAREWAANDPYARSGVFDRVEVFPYLPVLPA